jgi:hypothetical protein
MSTDMLYGPLLSCSGFRVFVFLFGVRIDLKDRISMRRSLKVDFSVYSVSDVNARTISEEPCESL